MSAKRRQLIYLDHNATTPLLASVEKAIRAALGEYGNPSSLCAKGRTTRALVEECRQETARLLGATPKEIIFTASGSEANNLAIKGFLEYVRTYQGRNARELHVVCSAIEHPSVMEIFRTLERQGFAVTHVPVDTRGFVRANDFKAALRPNTVLASIMLANNEVGALQPVARLARIARKHGVIFHTDAVQAIGKCDVNVRSLGVDMLSLSGHKMGAPKGVGALYIRQGPPARAGIRIAPLIDGGGQERGLRAGTENVRGIVGLGAAVRALRRKNYRRYGQTLLRLRQRLERGLRSAVSHIRVNSPAQNCLANTLNVSFEGVEAETIVMHLDLAGVCVSSGSACSSEQFEPSPVLLAMGLSKALAHGAVRFSLADTSTPEEIDYVLRIMPPIIEKLRRL